MTAVRATVLVPTHDHGALLGLAVQSALEQTIEDIEILIVGDGATDQTIETAEDLQRADARVRLFRHEKGKRHGEVYRHRALYEATGEIVCYLSDDDLWLPDHVATMAAILETADFAHAFPIRIDVDGRVASWPGHLSLGGSHRAMLEGRNFIPLSCAAHTLELYRRLPHGWRTTPEGTPTDLFMWQQILSIDGVRLAGSDHVTVLHFPSPQRTEMSLEERFEEMSRWSAAAKRPGLGVELDRRALEALAVAWAVRDSEARKLAVRLQEAEDRVVAVAGEAAAMSDRLAEATAVRDRLVADSTGLTNDVAALGHRVEVLQRRADRREEQLARITNSRSWRLRNAVLRFPGVTPLVRRAGRSRSRR
jgi:Glycosyl transferase family 2